MQNSRPSRSSQAIVIGAGPTGLLAALTLVKRGWQVRVFDSKAGKKEAFELPYVCSQKVEDFLAIELPDVLKALESAQARKISIAEILRSRFPTFTITAQDDQTRFLCMSRSLLQRTLFAAVAKAGLTVERAAVSGLLRERNRVTGVSLAQADGESNASADLVVDTSGAGRKTGNWIQSETFETYGPAYTSLAKFFDYDGPREKLQFHLARGKNFRGGIYPLEGQRFAIALIVPESVPLETPDSFFDRALHSIPEAFELLRRAKPEAPIQRLDGIRNRISNFYSGLGDEWLGFVPLGDSVMTGNPIYGRGLSLATIQLRALLEALDENPNIDGNSLLTEATRGFRESRKFWIDGATADRGEETSAKPTAKALHLLREVFVATVVSQLPSNPDLTRRFLYNYQLMLPAWRITGPRDYWTALSKLGEMTK